MLSKLNRPGLTKIGWASGAGAFSFLNTIVSQALASHMLSPPEFGSYLLLSSIVFGAIVFGLAGSAKIVVRLIAEEIARNNPSRAAAIAKQTYFTVGLRGLVVSALLFGAVSIASRLHWNTTFEAFSPSISVLLFIWATSATLNSIVTEMHRGYQDIRGATTVASLPGLLNIVLLTALLLSGSGSFLVAVICGTATMLIGTLWGTWSAVQLVKENTLRDEQNIDNLSINTRSLMSLSVLISDLTYYVLGHLGVWLLASFASPQAVAEYGAATRLASLVCFPLIIANLVLTPIIAQKASLQRNGELEKILRSTASLTVLPSIALCVIYIGLGKDLLNIIFGPNYSSGYLLLLILSIGQVANVALGSCGNALAMTGNQRIAMIISIISSLAFVILSVLLTKYHGAFGMALAASFGVILQNVLCVVAVKRKLGIWTHMSVPNLQLVVNKG